MRVAQCFSTSGSQAAMCNVPIVVWGSISGTGVRFYGGTSEPYSGPSSYWDFRRMETRSRRLVSIVDRFPKNLILWLHTYYAVTSRCRLGATSKVATVLFYFLWSRRFYLFLPFSFFQCRGGNTQHSELCRKNRQTFFHRKQTL